MMLLWDGTVQIRYSIHGEEESVVIPFGRLGSTTCFQNFYGIVSNPVEVIISLFHISGLTVTLHARARYFFIFIKLILPF